MALVMTKLLIALQVLSFVSGYPEITRCIDQICTMYCEHGFERDENGCEICECKQGLCNGEVCPEGKECRLMEINCQNSIPVGGSSSQAICDLKEKCMPECSDKQCKMYCHLGFERDENGCEVCKCKQELCNGQVCPDGTECRLVETNCQNSTSIHYSDSHPDCQLEEKCLPECVRSPCKRACKNGYVKDEYGCDTCQCLQELCNGQVCPEGTECQLVEVNCRKASSVETCDCMVAASEPVCELEDRCMPVPSCPDYDCIDSCDFGYVKDEHGCETCECLSGSNTHGEVRDNLFKKKVPCSDCEINSVPARTLAYVNLDGSDNTDNEINIHVQTVPRVNLDHLFAGVTVSVPSCPDYDCQDPCDSGYVKDEHGCETCECLSGSNTHGEVRDNLFKKKVPCSDCEINSVHAQTLAYVNLDGSDNTDNEINIHVQTVPRVNLDHLFAGVTVSVPSCPDYDCQDPCDSGYVKDEHGCETCECLSGSNTHGEVRDKLFKKTVPCSDCEINSVHAQTLAYVNLDGSDNTDNEINIRIQTVPRINLDHLFAGVTASVPSCPDYDCQDPCDSGYVKDEHGCETCECLSANDMREETNESLSTKTVPCSDCETKFITAQTLAYANLDDDLGARMTTETESD